MYLEICGKEYQGAAVLHAVADLAAVGLHATVRLRHELSGYVQVSLLMHVRCVRVWCVCAHVRCVCVHVRCVHVRCVCACVCVVYEPLSLLSVFLSCFIFLTLKWAGLGLAQNRFLCCVPYQVTYNFLGTLEGKSSAEALLLTKLKFRIFCNKIWTKLQNLMCYFSVGCNFHRFLS